MRRFGLTRLIFLSLAGLIISVHAQNLLSAWAQEDLDAEYDAIYEDDWVGLQPGTFDRYKALAERGHANSQYQIAYFLWYGTGVEESKSEARHWYTQAANNGSDRAAMTLAEMYEEGDSVPRSSTEAFRWYMRAAELGHPSAMASVGGHYYRGDGVAKSMTSAAYWFKQASDAGDTVGGMLLASVQKDYPDAVRNMSKGSASFGSSTPAPVAQVAEPQLTPASEGFSAFENGQYARAESILRPHADAGNSDAQNVLGIMYLDGLGVAASDQRAESWFRKAANDGNAAGLYHLGAMIYYQRAAGGVDPYETAKSLLQNAAGQGSDPARSLLAEMEELERQQRVADFKEYRDSIDDVTLNRCRNPRYVKVNGEERMFCD